MRVTLNYEAPGQASFDLNLRVTSLFAARGARTRVQNSTYQGPEGPVATRTIISKIDTPLNRDAVIEAVFALSCKLDQDCIAVRYIDATGIGRSELIGPRADKWQPFNPDYFVEY